MPISMYICNYAQRERERERAQKVIEEMVIEREGYMATNRYCSLLNIVPNVTVEFIPGRESAKQTFRPTPKLAYTLLFYSIYYIYGFT